ncbi:MAG: catalase [Clostridia bacterium]|jgi:hypothetical protein|nr:catalase [Clostridia bacterium]
MAHPVKHFITITHHRHKVIAHCFRVGIGWQGLGHDLSKYSLAEFVPGAKYYQGTRSPGEAQREAKGYSEMWLHHQGRNKHHYEYWFDYVPAVRAYSAVKMPVRYVAEMFCDRMAACKIYQKERYTDESALQYFMRGQARTRMHPETAALLESWLRTLAKEGERKAFAVVKAAVKRKEY